MTRQFAKEQAIVNDDAGLANRERVLKGRELSRREQRQDDYDTPPQDDDTTAEGQTFADFTKEVTLLGVDRLPAAFVRSDWATLAYEGKFNTIFGEVGSGKTWVALMMAIERLHAGRHVIWWDTEDQPSTLARRLQVLRATDLIGHPALKWTNGDFQDNPAIMAEALEGLGSGNGPGLVVIDSATSFGCSSDGGNVAARLKAFIDPWENAGHSVELLDHVPKLRKDRPRGGIGSQAKLARVDGSALYLHGNPWNATEGGYIHMQIHKDRHGQLPATLMGAAATITAEWDGPTLDYTVGLPNAKAEAENLEDELMDALDQAGPDGVRGGRAVRDLLKGKRAKDIDAAREELLSSGMIERVKEGKAYVYRFVG